MTDAMGPRAQGEGAAADASPAGSGRLPSFLVVGATKAGTASLHGYLRRHREVFVHPRKDLRFFADEREWRRGPGWYRDQFGAAGEAAAVGQVSNAYARHPVQTGVPERMAALVPDVRLVYLVREPFARLEAHYRRRFSAGHEWRGPEEALRADPSYVAASLYGLQLAEYRRHFASEQILVLRCEALLADPQPHLARLAEHLGIAHDPILPFCAEAGARGRRVATGALRRTPCVAPLRRSARQLGRAAARGPLGRAAAEADYALSDGLRAEIARLFAEDRHLLVDLAGPEAAAWPDPEAPVRLPPRPARVGRAAGFAEASVDWLGAALGIEQPLRRAGDEPSPAARAKGAAEGRKRRGGTPARRSRA